jgi:hypothetical protein
MRQQPIPTSPAVDLLTALSRGLEDAAVERLAPDVAVTVPQLSHHVEGLAEVVATWQAARALFPDLTYQPHTRHIGRGVVIDDAVVTGTQTGGATPSGLSLRMSVRIRVTHDVTAVQAVTADIDPTPLLQALGKPVDAYASAVSQVLAVRNSSRTDMVTYQLTEPPEASEAVSDDAAAPAGRQRTNRTSWLSWKITAAAVVLGVVGTSAGILIQRDASPRASAVADERSAPSSSPTDASPQNGSDTPKKPQRQRPPEKPNGPAVVLTSDLAFGFDSAKVSRRARAAGLGSQDRHGQRS